tara:strand:- start:309 stop:950 length:642 start_codon:yes stop_codon:yes gene_type:complete
MNQYNINFKQKTTYDIENYLVSDSNKLAYKYLIENNNNIKFIFLLGLNKSGKTHISIIWSNINNSLNINLNDIELSEIPNIKSNILIDDVFSNLNEEKLFHLINHCNQNNLKILLTSNISPKNYLFLTKDLSSRVNSFYLVKINQPDDFLIKNLIIKLFNDRQIKIKNDSVIDFITNRINRSFENVNSFVNKIDKYSLTNKREITIPLIKEII